MRAQWRDMAGRKRTSPAASARTTRDEAFGDPYELPPDRCYGETCAAIASVCGAGGCCWRPARRATPTYRAHALQRLPRRRRARRQRLLLRQPAARARRRTATPWTRRAAQPWYACACCPPNVMRLLASLQHYLATRDAGGVQIHQYASGEIAARPAAAVRGRRPTTRGTAASRSRSSRPPRRRGRSACACRRGRDGARLTLGGEEHDAPRARLRAPRRARWQPGDRVTLELAAGAAADRAAPAHRRRARLPGDRARPARLLRRGRRRAGRRARRRPPVSTPRRRCATSPAPTCSAASSPSRRRQRTGRPTLGSGLGLCRPAGPAGSGATRR